MVSEYAAGLAPLLPWKDSAPQPLRATSVDAANWFIKFQRFEKERLVPAEDIAASDPKVPVEVFIQHYEAFVKWRSQATPSNTALDALAQVPWTKARSITLEKSVIPHLLPPDCPTNPRALWKGLNPRYKEIVTLIAKGFRNAEIMAALGCSESQIHSAINKGKRLSGARDRVQLGLVWRGIEPTDPTDRGEWMQRAARIRKHELENAKPIEQYYVSLTGIAAVLTLSDIADLTVPDKYRRNKRARKHHWHRTGKPLGRPKKKPPPGEEQGS